MNKVIQIIFKTFLLSVLIAEQVNFSYAQTASILPPAKTTFLDNNGKPLVSGKVKFYIPGTTTNKTTWQDSGETIPNTNPVVLDGSGRAIILGDGSYRQQVFDRLGNLIWDQQTSSTGGGSGGGGTPTVGDGDAVGTVKPWAGIIAPNAYVFSYGQELARASFPLLFSTLTSQQNVACTSGSPTLTGVGDTSQLPIGAPIESVCFNAGTTIASTTISTVTASSNAIISTNTSARFFPFGNGDGSLTFNMPDLRGRVLAGRDNMGSIAANRLTSAFFGTSADAIGANGGAQSQTLTLNQIPTGIQSGNTAFSFTGTTSPNALVSTNSTTVAAGGNTILLPGAFSVLTVNGNIGTNAITSISNNTGGLAHSTIQPTQTFNYIIKTLPDTNPNTFFGVASIGGMTGIITCGVGLTCSGNNISAVTPIVSVPTPTPTTLGGAFSLTCATSNWFNKLDLTGTFGCSQPNFTDLLGTISVAQLASNPQLTPYTAANTSSASQTIKQQLTKIPVSCEDFAVCGTSDDTTALTAAMNYAATNGRPFQFNANYNTSGIALSSLGGALQLTGRGGLVAAAGTTIPLLAIKDSNNGIVVDGSIAFDCSSEFSVPTALQFFADGAGGVTNTWTKGIAFVNCRSAVWYGSPNFTDFTVDSNFILGGYTFNVPQGIHMYGSQTGAFIDNFANQSDNTSWGYTGTGSGGGTTTLTVATIAAGGFIMKDDVVTGTGVAAGTSVVAQLTGPAGGAGTYTVNQNVTTSGTVALAFKVPAWNNLVVGSTLQKRNGYDLNAIAGGQLYHNRPVNSGTFGFPYGRITVQGATIEGSDVILATDKDVVTSPGTGDFRLVNASGDFSANTNCYINTDAAFTGTISTQGGPIFSTVSRSAANVCPSNSAVVVYYDGQTFGSNMLQGTAGIVGGTPKFKTVSIKRTAFITPGTATYTRDPAAYQIFGECVGSGASGGGIAGVASTFLAAGGGGSGGYSNALLTSAQVGTSKTVTIPAGGAAATAGSNAGNAGSAASIGTLVVANGGVAGQPTSGTGAVGPGGTGATTSGAVGDETVPGGDGGGGSGFLSANGQAFYTGFGGASRWSGTAIAVSGASTGALGKLYGGGSAGATAITTGNTASLAGAQGKCEVTEYLMQ